MWAIGCSDAEFARTLSEVWSHLLDFQTEEDEAFTVIHARRVQDQHSGAKCALAEIQTQPQRGADALEYVAGDRWLQCRRPWTPYAPGWKACVACGETVRRDHPVMLRNVAIGCAAVLLAAVVAEP